MSNQFILASELNPLQTRKALRLRLVRTYEIPESRSVKTPKSKECLFNDQEGTYVHATIPKDYIDKYNDIFREGRVYGVKNFVVATNYYTYKTTQHRYMLKFNCFTLVKEYRRGVFPNFMFRLRSLDTLRSTTDVNFKELFDVIGKVVEIYAPREIIQDGVTSRWIEFVIEDARENRIKCTVWDHHVDAVMPYFNANTGDHIVVIIQLCRARLSRNQVTLSSSYTATQLFFEHDGPEFTAFKNSLPSDHTPVRSINSVSRISSTSLQDDLSNGVVGITTIADLYEQKKVGDFWIAAKIIGIQSIDNWSYSACMGPNYNKKLVAQGSHMYCSKCGKTWDKGVLKYKMQVLVADKSLDASILIWDRECNLLLGVTAEELADQGPKDNDSDFPKPLLDLCDKAYLFRVAVKQEQLDSFHSAFVVLQINTEPDLIAAYCGNLMVDQEKDAVPRMIDFDSEDSFGEDLALSDECNSLRVGAKGKNVEGSESDDGYNIDQSSSTHKAKKTKLVTVKEEPLE